MVAPCKDCDERHTLCHSTCEKYLQYKEKHNAEKAKLAEEININYTLAGLYRHRVHTKRKGGKR